MLAPLHFSLAPQCSPSFFTLESPLPPFIKLSQPEETCSTTTLSFWKHISLRSTYFHIWNKPNPNFDLPSRMSAFSNFALDDNLQKPTQGRRQDLAAAGGKNQKEGPKTRRGSHFWNTVLDICSNQGAKRETGGHRLQMGGPSTTGSPADDGPEPTSAACFRKDRGNRSLIYFWTSWFRVKCRWKKMRLFSVSPPIFVTAPKITFFTHVLRFSHFHGYLKHGMDSAEGIKYAVKLSYK